MSEKRKVFFCFLLMLSWLVASSRAQTRIPEPGETSLEGRPAGHWCNHHSDQSGRGGDACQQRIRFSMD